MTGKTGPGAQPGPAADIEGLEEVGGGRQAWHANEQMGPGTLAGPPPMRSLPVDSFRGTKTPELDAAVLLEGQGLDGGHMAAGEGMALDELLEQYVEVASPQQQEAGGPEADPSHPAKEGPAQSNTKRRRREGVTGDVLSREGGVSMNRGITGGSQGAPEALGSPEMEGRELRSGRRVLVGDAGLGADDEDEDTAAGVGSARGQRGARGLRGKRGAGAGERGRGAGRRGRTSSASGARSAEGTVEGSGGAQGPGSAATATGPRRARLRHGAPKGRRPPVETSVLAETDMGLLTLNQIIQRAEALEKMVWLLPPPADSPPDELSCTLHCPFVSLPPDLCHAREA